MAVIDSLARHVKCRITSASLENAINKIIQRCDISNLVVIDDITATFWVRGTDLQLLKRTNERVVIETYAGFVWGISGILRRPVILIGMALILFLTLYLPTRILFIGVYGNNNVTETQILDAAQKSGVQFGASREHVRSEDVKNSLLQAIPQLQWACINTKGSVAEIFVQERSLDIQQQEVEASDIVASKDGVITALTVYSGTSLCRVGQIVKRGQVLVSGYSDLGLLIKSEPANAEIMAETSRNIVTRALTEYLYREKRIKRVDRYSIMLGKNLIKFYKGSGISPPGCGRINKIYRLTLPGGYQLPISVINEQIFYFDTANRIDGGTDTFSWLNDYAESFVREGMVAGRIIKKSVMLENNGKYCQLTAHYRCNEMIAISKTKENYTVDGKRN